MSNTNVSDVTRRLVNEIFIDFAVNVYRYCYILLAGAVFIIVVMYFSFKTSQGHSYNAQQQ